MQATSPRLQGECAARARATRICSGRWRRCARASSSGARTAVRAAAGIRGAARPGAARSRTTRSPISISTSSRYRGAASPQPAASCIGRADAEAARDAVLEICRAAGARTVTKGKSMIAEEIAHQRSPRGQRHRAGRDRSRRIHHPAAPRAAEPHHRAGDPRHQGAGRRRASAPRIRELRPGAPLDEPRDAAERGAHACCASASSPPMSASPAPIS